MREFYAGIFAFYTFLFFSPLLRIVAPAVLYLYLLAYIDLNDSLRCHDIAQHSVSETEMRRSSSEDIRGCLHVAILVGRRLR